jgi:hypothetical protein
MIHLQAPVRGGVTEFGRYIRSEEGATIPTATVQIGMSCLPAETSRRNVAITKSPVIAAICSYTQHSKHRIPALRHQHAPRPVFIPGCAP